MDAIATTQMADFAHGFMGAPAEDFAALHAHSLKDPGRFWEAVWDFCDVIGDRGDRSLIDAEDMLGARFFPDAHLSYAENCLRGEDDEALSLIFRGEDQVQSEWSLGDIKAAVSSLQQFLRANGIGMGDRVAAMLPNMPEAIIALLGASSIGAIFSSCSPDFGVRAVLDRFAQIEPRVLIVPDGYFYNGKRIEIQEKLRDILSALPTVEQVLVVEYTGQATEIVAGLPKARALVDLTKMYPPQGLEYVRVPFAHPLYIVFSSGTTGLPKCIVHGTGGVLLQHLKEHRLHCDLRPGERFFYFTTCGWMMWNWLVSGLVSGLTLILYDGSPFYPGPEVLFDLVDATGIHFFGTSAKYIDAVKKQGLEPRQTHRLASLRSIASTGSPLVPESFEFVYTAIKPDVRLASISGGTDIVSCFVLGNPLQPVYSGEIMGPGLGMAIEIWNAEGNRVFQEKGELVCTLPFPSMPVMFWNDPEGRKYRSAYFATFPGIWHHGDFAEETGNGGYIIYGRSDATLNPGGVRIGTAEIYAQVEKIPEVLEAIAIGQGWQGDVRVVLFVRLRDGVGLDDALSQRIRLEIRSGASPRHVPAKILAVTDIPRTKSGKITELAVRDVVHGRPIQNVSALANPEALELYRDLPELRS